VLLNGHNRHSYSSHDKDYTNREYVLIRSEYGIINTGVDGEWEWNRNIDDPTILRTCNPINSFSWVWESGHSLRIANSISRMGGDDVVVVVLKTQ
jgi:hypothetical protein